MNENKSILIHFDDEHEPEDTIREVQGLIEEGYTSGVYPNWELISKDEDSDEDTTQLKKEDFSYECNSSGYMVTYRGQSIGGGGRFNHLHEPVGPEIQKQTETHRKYAESDIKCILNGNPGRIYGEAIDRVNRSEGE